MKKNGFTLVEVLAVIVLLAIITSIAVPRVIVSLNEVRKTTFAKGVNNIVDVVKLKQNQAKLKDLNSAVTYSFANGNFANDSKKLDLKGDLPYSGIIRINENKKVALALVSNDGKFCALKNYEDVEPTIKTTDDGICELNDEIYADVPGFCIVKFEPNNGNEKDVSTIRVKKGNVISKPSPDPEKNGYLFSSWNLKDGSVYDFKNKVNENFTLYAEYAKAYTVTFMNGSTKFATKTVREGDKVTFPKDPSKLGYTFKYWSESENGTEYKSSAVTKDMTLYAVYYNNYTVTFMNGSTKFVTKTVKEGDKVTFPTNPSKSGYTFKYWSESENGTEYKPSAVTKDMILYAVFSEDIIYTNANIVAAYKYDETSSSSTYCVIGEESTCKKISLVKGKTYPAGTIIKYKVNSSTTKYFHILHDDGDTLTLQQRENTVNGVAWGKTTDTCDTYYNSSNCTGPLNALSALESATKNWSNVNNQTYTIGKTKINGTVVNGNCEHSGLSCTTSLFTFTKTNVKARLIFVQEATNINCTESTCPIFVKNCLAPATTCGSYKFTDSAYWTMNGTNDKLSLAACGIITTSNVMCSFDKNATNLGVRAVVVITK